MWSRGLKSGFCGRSLANIAGSNPICLSLVNFVFSGRGLCDGLVPPPEGSYRMCLCVIECATIYFYSYNG